MNRRTLLTGAAALALTPRCRPAPKAGRTRVVFWHAMTAALAEEVNRLATAFNASQVPVRGAARSSRAATPKR